MNIDDITPAFDLEGYLVPTVITASILALMITAAGLVLGYSLGNRHLGRPTLKDGLRPMLFCGMVALVIASLPVAGAATDQRQVILTEAAIESINDEYSFNLEVPEDATGFLRHGDVLQTIQSGHYYEISVSTNGEIIVRDDSGSAVLPEDITT